MIIISKKIIVTVGVKIYKICETSMSTSPFSALKKKVISVKIIPFKAQRSAMFSPCPILSRNGECVIFP